MSNIRTTYSGLISLAINLVSVITGFGYMMIITRSLSIQEYGTWGLINSLMVYGIIFVAIPTVWLVRETARESQTEKTGILSSVIWSSLGVSVYLLMIVILVPQTNADIMILLFAAILVPVGILQRIISTINLGWKPQISSYGILISEIIKIPLALLFVYQLDLGVNGVIISLAVSTSSSIVLQTIIARKRLQGNFKFSIIKKWFKLSWVSLYPKISYVLYNSDVIIISTIIGSVEIIAYYTAALVIANVVSYAAQISTSVNSKLLGGGKKIIAIQNLTYSIYFAVPLLSLSIVFAEAGLTILNPVYKTAAFVVIFLSFRMLFRSFSGIMENYLTGIEEVDMKKNASIKDFLKSKFFTIPTFRIIQYLVYLLILSIVLVSMKSSMSEIELLIILSAISMIIHIPLMILLILKVRREFKTNFESSSILKYILSGFSVFGFLSFLINEFLILNEKLEEIIPDVLLFISIGVGLYVLITYLIDSKTKNLLNGIIQEFNRSK
jgi:O-antigen/teichoic acid export membrane protein